MLFVLQVMRVIPIFLFNASVMDVLTPYGRIPLALETGKAVDIQIPDFHTILTFAHGQREVSYPLIRLLERPRINFIPLPLRVDMKIYRVLQEYDIHLLPIGHRGGGSDVYRKHNGLPYIKENSMESFREVLKLGTNWAELDISITSDDVLVVHHDYKIGNTPIWNMTIREYKSQIKEPTILEDVFNELEPKINLLVEVKYPSEDKIEMEKFDGVPNIEHFMDTLVQIINKKRKDREMIISSFDPRAMSYLKKVAPELTVFFHTEGLPNKFTDPRRNSLEDAIQFCAENDLQGIITDTETISRNTLNHVTKIHSAGLQLFVYTWRISFKQRNLYEEIVKLECSGVDGLVTDDIPMINHIIRNTTVCLYNLT